METPISLLTRNHTHVLPCACVFMPLADLSFYLAFSPQYHWSVFVNINCVRARFLCGTARAITMCCVHLCGCSFSMCALLTGLPTQNLHSDPKMQRDVTVEVSSFGFRKTGLFADVCQHALILPVFTHHMRLV